MPHDYNPKQKAFISGGRKVSHLAVRAEIDKLSDFVAKEAARIANRYKAGKITLAGFETEMRALLKSGHIVAASVGKGGRARMTQRDWGRVGAKIKWQNGYLTKFARKIGRGTISEIATASRARSYASAIYISFASTFKESQEEFVEGGKNPARVRLVTNSKEGCDECAADEAEGWMSVDDMKELGSRICGDWCKCDLEFEDDE
jgi:hypothetical protein